MTENQEKFRLYHFPMFVGDTKDESSRQIFYTATINCLPQMEFSSPNCHMGALVLKYCVIPLTLYSCLFAARSNVSSYFERQKRESEQKEHWGATGGSGMDLVVDKMITIGNMICLFFYISEEMACKTILI